MRKENELSRNNISVYRVCCTQSGKSGSLRILPKMNHDQHTNSSATSNSSTQHLSSSAYSTRNLLMGSIGLTANLGAMVFLFRVKDIKWAVKISLLCLICSNIMTLSALIISGAIMCIDSYAVGTCLPLFYLTLVPTTVMYFMLANQSLYLYAAIFYPIQFRTWPKTRLALFTSVFSWITALIICVASVGFNIPPGLPCLPWLLIRGIRVIGTGITIVISSVIVLVVNFRVILQIRRRLRLVRSKSQVAPKSQEAACCRYQTEAGLSLEHPTNINKHQLPQGKTSSRSFRRLGYLPRLYIIPTVSVTCDTSLETSREMGTDLQHSVNAPDDKEMHIASPVPLRCRDISSLTARLLSADLNTDTAARFLQRHNTAPAGKRRNISWRWRTVPREKIQLDPCGPKMRKNIKLLTMFTLLCCFLNLPYSIFYIWLAFISEAQAFRIAQSMAGVVASSLNIVSCTVSPLLYVCGFVDWDKQCKK